MPESPIERNYTVVLRLVTRLGNGSSDCKNTLLFNHVDLIPFLDAWRLHAVECEYGANGLDDAILSTPMYPRGSYVYMNGHGLTDHEILQFRYLVPADCVLVCNIHEDQVHPRAPRDDPGQIRRPRITLRPARGWRGVVSHGRRLSLDTRAPKSQG